MVSEHHPQLFPRLKKCRWDEEAVFQVQKKKKKSFLAKNVDLLSSADALQMILFFLIPPIVPNCRRHNSPVLGVWSLDIHRASLAAVSRKVQWTEEGAVGHDGRYRNWTEIRCRIRRFHSYSVNATPLDRRRHVKRIWFFLEGGGGVSI